jgi:hypothetical protein
VSSSSTIRWAIVATGTSVGSAAQKKSYQDVGQVTRGVQDPPIQVESLKSEQLAQAS